MKTIEENAQEQHQAADEHEAAVAETSAKEAADVHAAKLVRHMMAFREAAAA